MRGLSWHHCDPLPSGNALTAGRADTRGLSGHLRVPLPTTVAFCARSQGSAPWQTQVIALGVPLLEHFPLDPVSYLQYTTSINLTLWYAAWRRHGTTVCTRQHRLAISLYPTGLGTDPAYRASLCAHPTLRGDAAARLCGDPGGAAHAECDDLIPATVIRFTL
jgi:hypothetical protein